MSEADTCRDYITPALRDAGWDAAPHSFVQERTFTDGRIYPIGDAGQAVRGKRKRADYLLCYRRDFVIAVVEAKEETHPAAEGMQQARDYAEILGLRFAYATNGKRILEFDFNTGIERELPAFPSPEALFERWRTAANLTDPESVRRFLTPAYTVPGKECRYYQQIAIHRAVQAILQGQKRVLITMATGTGKTLVAFQIAWKLWTSGWNATAHGAARQRFGKPKILFLSDRTVLVDRPKEMVFTPFGEARHKIQGEAIMSREMYFALYQAIAQDERRPGLFRAYPTDFFDLIIVDECHRGSAADDSNWRQILEYFSPAYQLGMTATPLREDNRDTYEYFGDPVYTYSLRQGIEDGFLAPYRVHKVITDVDDIGWRPAPGQRDTQGEPVPDKNYTTGDFERTIVLPARTQAIARHLTDHLRKTDRFAKTIVFCVDQDHAFRMRQDLNNLNTDLVQKYSNYVVRITSDEGDIGAQFLDDFMDPEQPMPVIVTTSKLLTTGVDVPTCKNIALVRVINAMTEFKQIIGRGARVNIAYDKTFFHILDYTGSAMDRFSDPAFDGEPARIVTVNIDEDGHVTAETAEETPGPPDAGGAQEPGGPYVTDPGGLPPDPTDPHRRKIIVDGVPVEIVANLVYQLDAHGNRLHVVRYEKYAGDHVRTLFTDYDTLRAAWAQPRLRTDVLQRLLERGIDPGALREAVHQPDADPFDLLCHYAFNAPVQTRRQRAARLRERYAAFFTPYRQEARVILQELLDKYAAHGLDQLAIPDTFKVPPLSEHGNLLEITQLFGGPDALRTAVDQLQALLYAA